MNFDDLKKILWNCTKPEIPLTSADLIQNHAQWNEFLREMLGKMHRLMPSTVRDLCYCLDRIRVLDQSRALDFDRSINFTNVYQGVVFRELDIHAIRDAMEVGQHKLS